VGEGILANQAHHSHFKKCHSIPKLEATALENGTFLTKNNLAALMFKKKVTHGEILNAC